MNYIVMDDGGEQVNILHDLKPDQITKLVEAGFTVIQLDFEIVNENQSQVVQLKPKRMDEKAFANDIPYGKFHEEHLIVDVH